MCLGQPDIHALLSKGPGEPLGTEKTKNNSQLCSLQK
jgi:hypothetical protein